MLGIINLERRHDRYEEVMIQLQQQGITDYKIFPGHEFRHDRKRGVCISHKSVVRYAKENNLPFVHVAEDDIVFNCVGAWDYYLSQIPKSYDIFCGMVYVGTIKDGEIKSICSGFTLYTVQERFYDFFLSIPDSSHVDREITKHYDKFEMKIIDQFVCHQSGSYSDNTCRKPSSYEPLLAGRRIYGSDNLHPT